MKRLALIFILLIVAGCGTLTNLSDALGRGEYTIVKKPDINNRPVFYTKPPTNYITLDVIDIFVKEDLKTSCDKLAEIAIDKLLAQAIVKGGHGVVVGPFSECKSNNRGRHLSVEGIALTNLMLLPPKVARVGEEFFSYSEGGARFDLTVVELGEEKLILQYSEFFMSDRGSWFIKQGFNKTFTYSPKEMIRFKGYEFEPISVINGQITYRRIK